VLEADPHKNNAPTQQELLRQAMDELGLTREQLGRRLCVTLHRLDGWLLPADDPNAKAMPETGKVYLREVLQLDRKRRKRGVADDLIEGSCSSDGGA
jgi:hypothetical protein